MTKRKRARKMKLIERMNHLLGMAQRRDKKVAYTSAFVKFYAPFLREINEIVRKGTCQHCSGHSNEPCVVCQDDREADVDHSTIECIMDDGFEVACQKCVEYAHAEIEKASRGLNLTAA